LSNPLFHEPGKEEAKGLTNARRNLQFTCSLAIGVVLLLSPSRADATEDENHIHEILAGANGNSKIQFIVINQEGSGNLWGPQPGETQSRTMLLFFDAAGRETGKFKFPHDPQDCPPGNPNGICPASKVLIATQDFANLAGAPTPDFIMPPLLNPIAGKVCFTTNPLGSSVVFRNDCVSYGANLFTGSTGTDSGSCTSSFLAGPAAPALPILNIANGAVSGAVSLQRTLNPTFCGSVPNSGFTLSTTTNPPTPTNVAGSTFTIPVSTQVSQGQNLFNNETFGGNGRSCGSCHVGTNLNLTSSDIVSRFAALLSPTSSFDPLFVAEMAPSDVPDSGFDFNLNTLVLTPVAQPDLSLSMPGGSPDGTVIGVNSSAPCIGMLTGIITSGAGASKATAKVLTQISPTTYLVYGGMNPSLSGVVSDSQSCSGTVSSITAGSLGTISTANPLGLENPKRMRTSTDTFDFPQGRGLILENIDGFGAIVNGRPTTPAVFRKSPHLLNLDQHSGPAGTGIFGLSNCCVDLPTFATGAVTQHFPRTLSRNGGGSSPDFRAPTTDELTAMAAFMNSLEFPAAAPPGAVDPGNKFDLSNYVFTAQQFRGQVAFFGPAKCSECHGGNVLGTTTVDIVVNGVHSGIGNTALFNTGVVNQSANTGTDNLICSTSTNPIGCGAFSVRQLFNVANLAPFFHDGSATALPIAVGFYDGNFNFSPAAAAIGFISLPVTTIDDITAFLEAISFSPQTPTFGPVGTLVTITGTGFNTGATKVIGVAFNDQAAVFTVNNDTTITTTVPAGATTGPILLTMTGPAPASPLSLAAPPGFSIAPCCIALRSTTLTTNTRFTVTGPLTFNPVGVSFGNQFVGTTNTTNVQLTNVGAATLNITAITLTGIDISQFALVAPTSGSPACSLVGASSINPGGSCFLGAQFKPNVSGVRSAMVSVFDNLADSPQTVALTGSAADFNIAVSGTRSAVTAAGQSASFTINLSALGGVATLSSTTFSATGNPAATTVTFSPPSIPAGSTTASTTMRIATTSRSSGPQLGPPGSPPQHFFLFYYILCLAFGWAVLVLTPRRLRQEKLIGAYLLIFALLTLSALAGCAGGGGTGGGTGSTTGGSTGTPAGSTGTPAGTSTITVTANSGTLSRTTTVTLTVQ
jgi:hypothetical protein